MKKIIGLLVTLFTFLVFVMPANAIYFVQDDFVQTMVNGTGAAGMVINADGQVLSNTGTVLGTFTLSGTNSANADGTYNGGTEYYTLYDTASLSIVAGSQSWSGSGSFYTRVNKNGVTFSIVPYYTPVLTQPTQGYQSIGAGSFAYGAGDWEMGDITLDWFGTYDWRYGAGQPIVQYGNLQGAMNVPEPISLLLLGLGLVGLAGIRRKFKSSKS